jgi:hypothetical protein
MMAFNPDAYLASIKQSAGGFNPDTYLAENKIAAPKPTPQELISQIPGASSDMQHQTPLPSAGQSWFQKALGTMTSPLDVGAGMLQDTAANIAGNVYGIGKEFATGNFGHGLAERTSAQFQKDHAYQPASPQGAAALQGVGSFINKSGIAGIGPDMSAFSTIDTLGGPAVSQFARGAKNEAGILGETARTAAEKAAPMIPGTVKTAARAVGRGATYLYHPEASAGAKGARAFGNDLESQIPLPGTKPVAPEPPPTPQGALQLPRVDDGAKPSTITANSQLENAIVKAQTPIEAARKTAGEKLGAIGAQKDAEALAARQNEASLKATISKLQAEYDKTYANTSPLTQGRPYPVQLRTRIAALQKELASVQRTGASGVTLDDGLSRLRESVDSMSQHEVGMPQAELHKISSQIEDIQKNPNTQLERLIKLRRLLSQKAKFGEPVTGFDAIGTHNAAKLSGAINDLIDDHIPEYAEMRGQYKNLLDAQEPAASRLLSAMGEAEGSKDYTGAILRDPKNLKLAVDAAGDLEAVDSAVAQRVQADLHGKSISAMQSYVDEHLPVLQKLPKAQKAATDIVSRAEAAQALQEIQKASEARFKAEVALRDKTLNQQADIYQQQHNAYKASHDLAAKYQGEFIDLNKLPASQLPAKLRGILSKMYDDKIITPQKYSDALDQVKLFEKSINRQKLVRRFTGAATAASFVQYALHRKMWNIIVGATD